MADPLSIAAILGIVYAGRTLCSRPEPAKQQASTTEFFTEAAATPTPNYESATLITNQYREPGFLGIVTNKKKEVPSFGVVSETNSRYPHGEPNHDFRERMYVSGHMNNFAPSEKTLVGPGLGLDPSIEASGGFQQLYRVNPNNVGAYRLTTLPGRIAPAQDTTGYRGATAGTYGEITQYGPSKTAFLPTRLPNVPGRAQGQGGALTGNEIRQSYQKTMRTTNRSETTYRGDALEFAPAKSIVPKRESDDVPSRNKADLNIEEYGHTNNPTPGIHSFVSGFVNEPMAQMMARNQSGKYSAKELDAYGVRVDENRGKMDRAGNAGRMNVRANPLAQGGVLTAVRMDTDKGDNYTGPANGGWQQAYGGIGLSNFNAYKGQVNNFKLNEAKEQLSRNPFAHTLSA
jgi:hypothetical protein